MATLPQWLSACLFSLSNNIHTLQSKNTHYKAQNVKEGIVLRWVNVIVSWRWQCKQSLISWLEITCYLLCLGIYTVNRGNILVILSSQHNSIWTNFQYACMIEDSVQVLGRQLVSFFTSKSFLKNGLVDQTCQVS